MTTTIPLSLWPSWSASGTISKTSPAQWRSVPSDAPSSVGGTRSLPWHRAHVSQGPTEAANNLIKRIKRVAFGLRRFQNFRIRVLLYAGRPNWDLLATIKPR